MAAARTEVESGRASRLVGDAFSVFGATVIALGVGFVTSIVVARLLGPDGRGLLGVAASVSAIAVAVGSMGVPIAISYYGSRRPRRMPQLVGSALAHASLVGVALAVIVLLIAAAGIGWPDPSAPVRFWGLTALLTWAVLLEFVAVNTLRARFLYSRTNALLVVSRAAILVLTLVLVALLDLGTNGALLALIAGSLTYAAGALPMVVRRGIGLSRHVLTAMVHYGWRVQVGRLIQIGNGRLDVLILAAFAPLATVGIYVVAQVIAELVLLVPTAIGFVAMPAIARGRSEAPDAGRTVRLSGSLSLVGVAGVAVAAPVLVTIGYGSAFDSALLPLYLLLPGVWLFGVGGVIGDVFRGRGRPGVPSVLAGIAIVVTVVLDLLLIPPFGAVGAAIASTCAYTVLGLSSAAYLGRTEGIAMRSLFVTSREETGLLLHSLVRRLPGRRQPVVEPEA